MFDTIRLRKELKLTEEFLRWLKTILAEPSETLKNGSYGVNGYLGNLKVSATQTSVFICNSICKYYHGNNFENLSWAQFGEAIKKLENELRLDLSEARVSRVDLSRNVEMKLDAMAYMPCLVSYPRLNRVEEHNGVYFRTSSSKLHLLFYNKSDARDKKECPQALQGQNLLRYELRIMKPRKVKEANFHSLDALLNKKNQNLIEQFWVDTYSKVKKQNPSALNFDEVRTVGDFQKLLLADYAKELGQGRVENLLSQCKARDTMSHANNYSGARRKLSRDTSRFMLDEGEDLVGELDELIFSISNTN